MQTLQFSSKQYIVHYTAHFAVLSGVFAALHQCPLTANPSQEGLFKYYKPSGKGGGTSYSDVAAEAPL